MEISVTEMQQNMTLCCIFLNLLKKYFEQYSCIDGSMFCYFVNNTQLCQT